METAHIDETARKEICRILSKVLADTYVLYVKTQNFHWNVEDPRFFQLHQLFESQYEDLAEAVDLLAERIRMTGGKSPGSLAHFLELTSLEESEGDFSGNEMLAKLSEDHTLMADILRSLIDETADSGDEGTADLLINRLRSHEKSAWMLRSHL